MKDYVGRPSPLYHAERLTEHYGGAEVWLKREDLNHTGAHKINNSLGQVLLCLRMSKKRIIAETGAGQHGVATATVCAKFGLPCIIYMGEGFFLLFRGRGHERRRNSEEGEQEEEENEKKLTLLLSFPSNSSPFPPYESISKKAPRTWSDRP